MRYVPDLQLQVTPRCNPFDFQTFNARSNCFGVEHRQCIRTSTYSGQISSRLGLQNGGVSVSVSFAQSLSKMADSTSSSKSSSLFQVYLRLRPPPGLVSSIDRFITIEPPATDAPSTAPTHITLDPPNDRRRAVEKFVFTQVFEEDASQLDVFHCTNILPLVEGILAPHGGEGTDALLATLGVTGSGKVW